MCAVCAVCASPSFYRYGVRRRPRREMPKKQDTRLRLHEEERLFYVPETHTTAVNHCSTFPILRRRGSRSSSSTRPGQVLCECYYSYGVSRRGKHGGGSIQGGPPSTAVGATSSLGPAPKSPLSIIPAGLQLQIITYNSCHSNREHMDHIIGQFSSISHILCIYTQHAMELKDGSIDPFASIHAHTHTQQYR